MILAVADIAGSPERVFHALTTNEVEQWWAMPGVYRQKEWKADLRVCGPWSVAVETVDGGTVRANTFQGTRETTITYRFEPSPYGTRVTVRDEGFIGRSEAAYGNAEIREKVLGWLDAYLARDSVSSRTRRSASLHSPSRPASRAASSVLGL
jgi:uncharacterized protein YndB with AHSA1/START domain